MSRYKTSDDIEAIKQSVVAAEAAMVAVIEYLKSNETPTSEEAKDILDSVLAKHNCHSPENRIVAGGRKTHEPHYMGEGSISSYEPIVIDIYPQSKETGFYADMTRTVCVGEPPSQLKAMYDAVQAAHSASVAMLGPGVGCSDVHMAAATVFEQYGYQTGGVGSEFTYAEGFVHSVGHGLGQDVHESPTLNAKSGDMLQIGDIITIEPGLYYKDIGGVRLEDLFVITENGYEQLTTLPLELRVQHW